MRILHAVASDAFAGVERHVALLASAQHDAGHQVVVVGGQSAGMRAAVGDVGVTVLPGATLTAVARSLGRYAPYADVVHAHMTSAEVAAEVALVAAGTRGVPIVATRHFAGIRGAGQFGPAARWVAPLVRRRLAGQIAVSRFVADHIDGSSRVVYSGVRSRPSPPPAARERVVLVAQRLEPEKDTELAVRAFARSGLAALGWRLVVAGDGRCRDAVERAARSTGLLTGTRPSASFLGHQRDVETLMAQASILLAPCAIDGLGLSVIEAMASGLPVVAAAAAGHLETVGRVDGGALFAPGSVDDAARVLTRLASDAEERARLAAEQHRIQQSLFTLQAQHEATDAVYRAVL